MKKKLLGILLMFAVVLGIGFQMQPEAYAAMTQQEADASIASRWMKFADGSLYLSQLNIPGTHEAGSKDCAMGQCQDNDIAWQLEHGVRFLDIRILIGDNDLRVYHGKFSAKLDFKDVMQTVKTFLAENPSECVIMSIKNEGDTEVNGKKFYEELENNYIKNSQWSELFYTSTSIPKLDNVRGKIVLVRRYGNSSLGLNATGWSDNNKDFTINRSGYKIRVQDYYQPEDVSATDILTDSKAKSFAKDKWSAFSAFDDKAKASGGSSNTLWINFGSGNIMGTHTDTIADIVNPQIVSRMESDRLSGNFHGIVAMDWAGDSEIQAVYMSNKINREVSMKPRINGGAVTSLVGVKSITLKSSDTGKTYTMTESKNAPGTYLASIDATETALQLVIDDMVYKTPLEVDTRYDTLDRPYLFQVRYESGGDIAQVPVDNRVYQAGDTVTVDTKTYTKTGKTFMGWTLVNYRTVKSFTIEQGDYVLKDWWTSNDDSGISDGMTLGSNVYTVSKDTTVVNLRVKGNAVLNVLPGVTLTCIGSDGYGAEGGKAGIYVPEGSSLTLVGGGTVNARGGKGGSGSPGMAGENGVVNPNDYDGEGGFGGGRGGNGGAGGGGAGAGIGTDGGRGGDGGAGGAGAEYSECIYGDKYDKSGSAGSAGKDGSKAAACGYVFNDGVDLYTWGGATGDYGRGGDCGDIGKYKWKRYFTGSGGGGGGGGGRFTSSNGYYQTGGEGGFGGKSDTDANRGSVGTSLKYDSYTSGTTSQGKGGAGGSVSQCVQSYAAKYSPYIRYTIRLNSSINEITPADSPGTTQFTVHYGYLYPSVTIPKKKGYIFEGYWTGRSKQSDEEGGCNTGSGRRVINQYGSPLANHADFMNTWLYASWRPISYTISYNPNCSEFAEIKETNRLYGRPYTLRKNTYERKGYKFLGWTNIQGTSGVVYSDEAAVFNLSSTDGAEVKLYAVWQDIRPTAEQIAAAKEEVQNYKNKNDYRAEQQTELETAITLALQSIDAASSTEELDKAVADAKEVMDMIKTNAQLAAEEEASLTQIKENAKAELAGYKDLDDYRQAQKQEIADLITSGNSKIDAAADADAVQTALANAKAALDEVKTDKQLAAEEAEAEKTAFEKAKADALSEIENYKSASDYRYAQRKELSAQIAEGKANIEAAGSIAAVERALANAKSALDRIKTSAQLDAEEAAEAEQALADAKTSAKDSLQSYRQIADYRYAERKLFRQYLKQGLAAIEEASSIRKVDEALAAAQTSIDSLKTNLEYDAEEVEAAKIRHGLLNQES